MVSDIPCSEAQVKISQWLIFPVVAIGLGMILVAAPQRAIPEPSPSHPDSEYAAHVDRLKSTLPPGFTILVQKPFVIAGDAPPDQVRAAARNTIQWAVDHLKKDYFDKDPNDLIDIYLFRDKTSYDQYTKELFHDT